MRADDSELWELTARNEICELKARYFRAIDTKDWALFGEVFTPDAELRLRGLVWHGREAIVAWASEAMLGGVSVHQGHMPEITFTSRHEARGIWQLHDLVERGDGSGFEGYGFYHERYERSDAWRIADCEVQRLRLDRVAGLAADTVLPPPPELA